MVLAVKGYGNMNEILQEIRNQIDSTVFENAIAADIYDRVKEEYYREGKNSALQFLDLELSFYREDLKRRCEYKLS